MLYFVETKNGDIVSKHERNYRLSDNYKEINKSLYDSIGEIPCSFVEVNGEITSIEYIEPIPIVIIPEPNQDDYLLDLDYRLCMVELGLGGI